MNTGGSRQREIIKKAREEIEKKTGKTPEQLYKEREQRISDAIQLKVPDRVPVCMGVGHFPIRYAGLSESALWYDFDAYQEAAIKTLLDFEPDMFHWRNPISGLALEKLGQQQFRWAGGSLRSDQADQFVDMEIMKGDEYDLFITDPGDFILRYHLPRAFGALAPLSKLPSLLSLVKYNSLVPQSIHFISPEIIQAFETLYKVGQEQAKFSQCEEDIHVDMGIPPLFNPAGVSGTIYANPPFDLFVTYLRGMRGIMVDMFKRPEKLLAALDKTLEWELARAIPADPQKRRVSGGSNHFSSKEFLSRKQFETFVWPTWKKSLLAMIDLGFIPWLFLEGKNDDRLEYFLELPKGKAFVGFEKIDMAKAKDVLGGHLCIMGDVPASLLWGGSPQEVEEYCKNLIKICGKDGGFILNSACQLDDAKPANVKAMIDSVKKYGRY